MQAIVGDRKIVLSSTFNGKPTIEIFKLSRVRTGQILDTSDRVTARIVYKSVSP